MAPTQSTTQLSASSDPDPLTPKAPEAKKTRYSARMKTEDADKAAAKAAKAKEKALASAPPVTTEEKVAEQTQAAPLGLNGDTVKKQKPKKVKGAPKERLQNKEKEAPTEGPAPEPTVNPNLGATPAGATPPPIPSAPAPTTPAPPQNTPAPPQN